MTENNNLFKNPETHEQTIIIKIKTIDSNEYLIDIQKDALVTELKSRIESVTQVPILRQRLIFQGKLLQDKEKLSFYKISDSNVVHLVAKAGSNISNNAEESRSSNQSEQSNSRGSNVLEYIGHILDDPPSSFADILGGFRERDNNSNSASNTQTSTTVPSVVRSSLYVNIDRNPVINRRIRSNAGSNNPNVDLKETKEVIKQNILTIENFLDNTKTNNDITFNVSQILNSDNNTSTNHIKLEFLNFKNRKLKKGQWVDVKDTINEWLEAQVIDIKGNKAHIHYNGWGSRWDEWIDMDSDRIQLFRTHTQQSTLFNYHSPFPTTKPDASINLPDNGSDDINEILKKISKKQVIVEWMNDQTNKMIDNILESKNINGIDSNSETNMIVEKEGNHELQKDLYIKLSKFSPFIDKYGRMLADLGQYLYNSLKMKNFENIDQDIYKNQEFKEIYEKNICKDINVLQTPLNIHQGTHNSPSFFDIVVHTTYISPFRPGNNNLRDGGLGFLDLLNLPSRASRTQTNTDNNNNINSTNNSVITNHTNQNSENNNNIIIDRNTFSFNTNGDNNASSLINIPNPLGNLENNLNNNNIVVVDNDKVGETKLLNNKREGESSEHTDDRKKERESEKRKRKKKNKSDEDIDKSASDELDDKKNKD